MQHSLTIRRSIYSSYRNVMKCNFCNFTMCMPMGGGTFFKVRGHKCTSKKYINFLWFELATVTSHALKRDVIACTPYEGLNYTIWDKIKPLWKLIGETPEIQLGCYRGDPGQQLYWNQWYCFMIIPQAHHTIYTDWVKPFEACVTEISICSHSGWHNRCSVTLVT